MHALQFCSACNNLRVSHEIGLRERKKAVRRDALVNVARELVLAHGLDGVTVEDICASVEVSPRTFFNYFATKEDAVLGLPLDELGASPEVEEAFALGGPSGDLLDDGASLLLSMMNDPRMQPDRVLPVMELLHREPRLIARHVMWIESQREMLESLLARREEKRPTGIDPCVTASLLASVIRASALTWKAQSGEGTPADHLSTVMAQVRRLATLTARTNDHEKVRVNN